MRFAFCAAALALMASAAFAQKPDCSLVPGWKQQGDSRFYTAENLFEYMDGNAEGYIVYRLVNMRGVNCESPAGTVVFDVFEMPDSEWAYGVFAANRDNRVPTEKIGAVAQVVPRLAIVVKDKYFAQISIDKDQPEVVRQFAAAFASRIEGANALPAMLGWFPQERLKPESIRLVPESVLGLRALKKGYVAQYEYGKAFLIADDSADAAGQAMEKVRARMDGVKPVKIGDEAFEASDKYLGRICLFRKGRYLGGFAGLKEGEDAAALAAKLAASIP